MKWFLLIIGSLLLLSLYRAYMNKIDNDERRKYKPVNRDMDLFYGLFNRFSNYKDFYIVDQSQNYFKIEKDNGKSILFTRVSHGVKVEYLCDGNKIYSHEVPFFVHPDEAFRIINTYYQDNILAYNN